MKIIRAVTIPLSLMFCREVMIKLRAKGHEMVALTSPGPELEALRDDDGFRAIEVAMERHVSPIRDLMSLIAIIRVFLKEKPDMVHSMTPKAGLLCMIAAWLTRVPVRIHTFTGLVWPTASGLSRLILKTTDRITCACATHIIPEGEGVMNDLKSGNITNKPMKVLGYGNVKGIDLELYNPDKYPIKPNGPLTFLFVGRMVGDKGLNELVDAFVRLNQEHSNTCLVLVGMLEGNLDPINPATMQMIVNNHAIEYKGAKYDDELLTEYASADCFVMPSYREGFPNTVIEAGAMNLPCIVTDINGSREIIEDGVNGLIVPPRDSDALYNAMKKVVTEDGLLDSMASKARPMIASRFDKSYVQQCLIDFYKEIANV